MNRLARIVPSPAPISAAAALALAAGLAATATAADKSWDANSGDWSVAGNWTPIGVPLSTDVAHIGNLGSVQNNTVYLDQDDSVAGLVLSDGMTLRTDGFNLFVNGITHVTEANSVNNPNDFPSTLRVTAAGLAPDFFGETINITSGGVVALSSGGYIRATDQVTVGGGSRLSGIGTVELSGSGTTYVNIGTTAPGSGTLLLTQSDDGLFDLDGSNGTGVLNLSVASSHLSVDGPLTDAVSGSVLMAADSHLQMTVPGGWFADAPSEFNVSGTGPGGPARITGTPLTFAGNIDVVGIDGHLSIESVVVFQSTATASIEGRIDVAGSAIVNGGEFTLGDDARLAFEGPTELRGGTFNTFSHLFTQGHVSFDGGTEWAGDVTINGIARQLGNVLVSDATVITADAFDMDGNDNAVWSVTKPLTINAGQLETAGSIFNGMLNVSGALVGGGNVTINLEDPEAEWTMAGQMNLTGHALYAMRVAGSPMRVSGEFIIVGGNVNIGAPVEFANSAEIVVPAASNVRFFNGAFFDNSATFIGEGNIANWNGADMTLESTLDSDDVGLQNLGTLHIDEGGGWAAVDRFQQYAAGTLAVQIGGAAPGVDYDRLYVTGGAANLDGTLSVELADLYDNGVVFKPEVGDTFMILTSVAGGVSGTFDNDPVSEADGYTYEWSIIYSPTSVTIQLDAIVGGPCAADFDGDGFVTGLDFDAYVAAFEAGDMSADFDEDGFVTGLDFDAYVIAFENGC